MRIDSVPEDRESVDAQSVQIARLRQFIIVDMLGDLFGGALVLAIYFFFPSPLLPYLAAMTGIYALLMVAARRRVMRGNVNGAVTTICIAVWIVSLTVAFTVPMLFAVQGLLALLPVAVALPYAGSRLMRRLIVGSVLVLLASSLLSNFLSDPLNVREQVPQWVISAILIVFIPIAAGMIFLMLWQYSNRLNDALAEMKRTNQQLRESERLLEQKVLERTAELEAKNEALHRSELDLASARDAALEASNAKSAFLANMSHELRTPLNAIIGYSEMLLEEAEEAGEKRFIADLEKISGAGKHLLNLINAVLDLSKIEAGKMELFIETFEIRACLEDILPLVQPLARQRANRLELAAPDDVGSMKADKTKLRQAIFNLLSNACKFTQHGTITLSASRTMLGGGECVQFVVADTGIGLTDEQISKLFQEFSQADAATSARFGGTGLGLALSRRFCRLMGGEISVHSDFGHGSTFTITLPAEVMPPARRSSVVDALSRTVPEAPADTVLVIDDDPAARDLIERFLAKEGFHVALAASGPEGLRRARELLPTVITLDVLMPGLDGWSVLAALKQDPDLTTIPVIVISIADDRNRGFALGASDYLMKPIERDRLLGLINRYYRRSGGPSGPVMVVDDDPASRELLRRTLDIADSARGV